jgi:hypothetical protein
MKNLKFKIRFEAIITLRFILSGIFAFWSINSFACLSIPRPFYVEDSTFPNEDFFNVFTKYGMALNTGGDLIVFSQADKKWCYLANPEAKPDCTLNLNGPILTDSKTKVPVGYIDLSKDSPSCLLIHSLMKNSKDKDTSRPYVRICDSSKIDQSDSAFNELSFNIELIQKSKVIGNGTSSIAVTTGPEKTFNEVRFRSLASEEPLRFGLAGKSFDRSGCGNTELTDFVTDEPSVPTSQNQSNGPGNQYHKQNLLQSTH